MKQSITDSIKARLLNASRQRGEEFELYLVRYVCERFLYRLGESEHRERCTLKGASLLALWMEDPYRATRDVDLLALGGSDNSAVRKVMEEICKINCEQDGLVFDISTLKVSPIRESQSYSGQRATIRVQLGSARVRLQVDIGFGDSMSPGPEVVAIPPMLNHLPVPTVQAYPKVCSIAEKFEAMVTLGRRTSRMKDFHDIWALSESFSFDGLELQSALRQCFERRNTDWVYHLPDVLIEGFYRSESLATRWRAYIRKGSFRQAPPPEFVLIGERVLLLFLPIRHSVLNGAEFQALWRKQGPWSSQ